MGFRGVWLTPDAAIHRQFCAGIRSGFQKGPPDSAHGVRSICAHSNSQRLKRIGNPMCSGQVISDTHVKFVLVPRSRGYVACRVFRHAQVVEDQSDVAVQVALFFGNAGFAIAGTLAPL